MTKEKMQLLDKILEEKNYKVNPKEGVIQKKTSEAVVGFLNKDGLKLACLSYGEPKVDSKGRRRKTKSIYTVGSVIAYTSGLYLGLVDPENYLVRHKNGDKNDTRVDNLYLETTKDRVQRLRKNDKFLGGARKKEISNEDKELIIELYKSGHSVTEIFKLAGTNADREEISRIVKERLKIKKLRRNYSVKK